MIYKRQHVLIIDDDEERLSQCCLKLIKNGYDVSTLSRVSEITDVFHRSNPDVLIVGDSFFNSVIRAIYNNCQNEFSTRNVPLIVIADELIDKKMVEFLNAGADDYLLASASDNIFIAKINAIQSRYGNNKTEKIIQLESLKIIPKNRFVYVYDEKIELSATEYNILHMLAMRPEHIYSRQTILNELNGIDNKISLRAIDVQISNLRKKLESMKESIQTVRGFGYRLS